VRQSLQKASSYSPFVFYTESDKFDFFRQSLPPFFEEVRQMFDNSQNIGWGWMTYLLVVVPNLAYHHSNDDKHFTKLSRI